MFSSLRVLGAYALYTNAKKIVGEEWQGHRKQLENEDTVSNYKGPCRLQLTT